MSVPSSEGTEPEAGALAIRQKRSQVTYDKLIEAAFALLQDREWEALPVAEIAERAGYSVGAFYARFKNKDEFHRALVARYAANRLAAVEKQFATIADDQLLHEYFREITARLWLNRSFWRASLFRSIQEPNFWQPFRQIAQIVSDNFIARASRRIGRSLTPAEEMDIRFAVQVANGVINNVMINRPGPVDIDDPEFVERIERAFREVSHWDDLR
ncbi:MAG: TetR/AcrR family transcriptional regulator [Alphaproteobacteria bacterium]